MWADKPAVQCSGPFKKSFWNNAEVVPVVGSLHLLSVLHGWCNNHSYTFNIWTKDTASYQQVFLFLICIGSKWMQELSEGISVHAQSGKIWCIANPATTSLCSLKNPATGVGLIGQPRIMNTFQVVWQTGSWVYNIQIQYNILYMLT